jgi:hypothetical protein
MSAVAILRVERGTTLVIGLILLSLVTLLGLAGASTAHVEQLLAQNELFRENAASAANAGIESALRRIVTTPDLTTVSLAATGVMPDSNDRYDTVTRFAGFDLGLPQAPGAHLAGAHFDIVSTGFASHRAVDRQRAEVMLIVAATEVDATSAAAPAAALICEPDAPVRCLQRGDLVRLSWQRIAVE